jgi:uncharacterized BrkB/YihY/UPF0761 family membrane protein
MPYVNGVLHIFLPGSAIELNAVVTIVLDSLMPFFFFFLSIRLGSIGVFGCFGLIFSFLLAIEKIESNMNIVWGVNESRGYGQKAAIFIPFLLLFAGGIGILSIFLRSMREILEDILVKKLPFGEFGELLATLSTPATLLVLALVGLWILYCYMPYVPQRLGFWKAFIRKTKRRWLSSIISAVFTFAAITGFGAIMIILQAGMFAKWSLFYGSLAIFPMIMFLLFGFWCIVLFGNSLCWRITERKKPQEYFLNRIATLSGLKFQG